MFYQHTCFHQVIYTQVKSSFIEAFYQTLGRRDFPNFDFRSQGPHVSIFDQDNIDSILINI